MSLQTAVTNIKTAASAAIDTVKVDVSKADTAKTSLLSTIEAEIGTEAIGIAAFFQREETKATSWENRHLKLINLIALGGWLAFAGVLALRLHG